MFTLINVSFSHQRKLLSLPDLYLSIVLQYPHLMSIPWRWGRGGGGGGGSVMMIVIVVNDAD